MADHEDPLLPKYIRKVEEASRLQREAGHQQNESSPPSKDGRLSDVEIDDAYLELVDMLLTKLRMTWQDPSFTDVPQDGAADDSKGQLNSQKDSESKSGSEI